MNPLTLLSLAGGLGGGGGTKVNTSNKSNVTTQLSIGLSNQVGTGSPSPSGGNQSAPVSQTTASDGGSTIPVFGANPSANPSADLNSLLTGSSGLSGVAGNKGVIVLGAVAAAAVALFFGLKGRK